MRPGAAASVDASTVRSGDGRHLHLGKGLGRPRALLRSFDARRARSRAARSAAPRLQLWRPEPTAEFRCRMEKRSCRETKEDERQPARLSAAGDARTTARVELPRSARVNEPRAHLLLEAHRLLTRVAARHQLISAVEAAESDSEFAVATQARALRVKRASCAIFTAAAAAGICASAIELMGLNRTIGSRDASRVPSALSHAPRERAYRSSGILVRDTQVM